MTEQIEQTNDLETINGWWDISSYHTTLLDVYGIWILQQCVSILYAIYLRFTFYNVVIFTVKYVPPSVYTYKLIKTMIRSSRERLKEKQMELEDIQLQVEIINAKLCVQEMEYNERAEVLSREIDRVQRLRAQVRDVIASDESLQQLLREATDSDSDVDIHNTTLENDDFIHELIKNLHRDQYAVSQLNLEKFGEDAGSEPLTSKPNSVSDVEVRQDCRVKIVRVTNVYKVAYLRNYIKQKKLRRAAKSTALKKKMESIKKLLEEWQKTLSMVINSKLTILNIDANMEVASQEAMGDYSKPYDCDIDSDAFSDDYSLRWMQNPYRPFGYNFEDIPETAVSHNVYNQENSEGRYTARFPCEGFAKCPQMMSIVEETGSQLAIEEVSCDGDDCMDAVAV